VQNSTVYMAERGLLVHKGCWKKRGNALFLQPDLDLWDGNFYMAERGLTGTQGLLDKEGLMQPIFYCIWVRILSCGLLILQCAWLREV